MKYVDVSSISLTHIITFLAAARFENFSMAAKYLYTTQPVVSRTIASLESILGFELFTRERQHVSISAAGRALADSWQSLNEEIEMSIRHAQEINEHQESTLKISDDRGTEKNLYLYPILDRFSLEYPDVPCNIEQTDAAWSINSIYRNTIDLAFIMAHETANLDSSLLQWKIIYNTTWGVYINKSNPLFYRDSVTIDDIHNEPVVMLSTVASNSYSANIFNLYHKHGYQPNVTSYVSNNASLAFALHQGNGLIFANEFLSVPNHMNTKFFPLADTHDGLALVWHKDPRNPMTLPFVALAEKYFAKEYTAIKEQLCSPQDITQ